VHERKRLRGCPLAAMVGGGAFALEPGQRTDDTSMALCLATSLARWLERLALRAEIAQLADQLRRER